MEKTMNSKKGSLRVSENVIMTIVKNAVSEVEGVSRIANRTISIRSFLQSDTDQSDIRVTMLDGVCRIALTIIASSGYNIVNVCEQLQTKIKAAVQSMTGVTVSKVDITVDDVDFVSEATL